MKSFVAICLALALAVGCTVGCDNKSKTQTKETMTTPGGSTTTTDTHEVKSSGDNPPANASGETGK